MLRQHIKQITTIQAMYLSCMDFDMTGSTTNDAGQAG